MVEFSLDSLLDGWTSSCKYEVLTGPSISWKGSFENVGTSTRICEISCISLQKWMIGILQKYWMTHPLGFKGPRFEKTQPLKSEPRWEKLPFLPFLHRQNLRNSISCNSAISVPWRSVRRPVFCDILMISSFNSLTLCANTDLYSSTYSKTMLLSYVIADWSSISSNQV